MPPPSAPPSSGQKLYGIELLRFGAALAVLLAHYNHFYHDGLVAKNYAFAAQPLFWLFQPFYQYGTRAVEVFWCVSGFIFFHQYGTAITGRNVTAGRFFWLRFSRLYPLHFVTLLAVALLQLVYYARHGSYFIVALNDLRHFGLNLLFASHWGFQSGFSFNAPVWSVSLEILAYGFFFAATWFFRADLFMTVLWLLGCVALNYFLGHEAVFVRCLFYFYLGGLSCLCYKGLAARLACYKIPLILGAGALLALCLHRFHVTADLDTWILNTGTPLSLLLAALVSGWITGWVATLAGILGNLTYASYLVHFPLQIGFMLVVGLLGIPRDFAHSPWFLLSYLAVVLVLSRIIFLNLELPAQMLLRRKFVPSVKS